MIYKNKIVLLLLLSFITLIIATQNLEWGNDEKELAVIKISFEDCNPQKQECNVELDDLKLKILFDKDIFYLKPFNVSVSSENTRNNNVESVYIEFKMKNMDMGINRFKLMSINNSNQKQSWIAKAILPVCVNGRSDWVATILMKIDNAHYRLSFSFEVRK